MTDADKLKQLLELLELSASGLAQAIDVNRSSLSHIQSGRNNFSLELLQKLKQAYPQISTEWLFLNEGEIRRTSITYDEEDVAAENTYQSDSALLEKLNKLEDSISALAANQQELQALLKESARKAGMLASNEPKDPQLVAEASVAFQSLELSKVVKCILVHGNGQLTHLDLKNALVT